MRFHTIEGARIIKLPNIGVEIEIVRNKLSTFLETSQQGLDTRIVETELKRCSELHVKCVELNQEEDVDFNRPTFDFPRKLKAHIKMCDSSKAQVNQNIGQLVLKIDCFKGINNVRNLYSAFSNSFILLFFLFVRLYNA